MLKTTWYPTRSSEASTNIDYWVVLHWTLILPYTDQLSGDCAIYWDPLPMEKKAEWLYEPYNQGIWYKRVTSGLEYYF